MSKEEEALNLHILAKQKLDDAIRHKLKPDNDFHRESLKEFRINRKVRGTSVPI